VTHMKPTSSSRMTLVCMSIRSVLAFSGMVVLAACAPARNTGVGGRVLRVVPQADLEILDPIWSTADITRDHGYLIYDTLFGMDVNGRVMPQMVDTYQVSADKKTWTFTLRDGLEFHDGTPVTAEDVIASLQRWGQRDVMGKKLLSFVEGWETVKPDTFRMKLRQFYGLVLESLGKPSSSVPFIMPRRVATMPVNKQIDDTTGSGPFVFKKDEWRPGEKVVYVKNAKYRPRAEPASGTAGGKVVKVDRVEWIVIRDAQTQANALAAGEIDVIDRGGIRTVSIFQKKRRDPVGRDESPGQWHLLTLQPSGTAVRQRDDEAGGDVGAEPASVLANTGWQS
jgi:peptide/nickel transport system substrate-binding protein